MSEEKEIWKDVPGYGGRYQVSTFGRFKSMYRKKYNSSEFVMKEKYYTLSSKENKYIPITLFDGKLRKTILLHQIVAITFLNHKPNGYELVVDHINGIKTDNRLANIQIVTHSENLKTCFRKEKEGFTSKLKGVYFQNQGKTWRSDIRINGKTKHLGSFKTELDAHTAYLKEVK